MLKYLVLLAAVAFGGYKAYLFYTATPLEGDWQPNKEFFLKTLAQRGVTVTPEQDRALAQAMRNMKLTITTDKLSFAYPNISGDYAYTAKPTKDNCFDIDATKLGHLIACRKENQLELTHPVTGKHELLDKQ